MRSEIRSRIDTARGHNRGTGGGYYGRSFAMGSAVARPVLEREALSCRARSRGRGGAGATPPYIYIE